MGGTRSLTPIRVAAERYDPGDDRWRAAAPPATPRDRCPLTPLADGSVLLSGGCADVECRPPVALAERYVPATGAAG